MKMLAGIIACMALIGVGEGSSREGKLSGYMFGDYFYIAASHDENLEDRSGFLFRRIYLTYDKDLEEGFSVRLRLEAKNATTSNTISITTGIMLMYFFAAIFDPCWARCSISESPVPCTWQFYFSASCGLYQDPRPSCSYARRSFPECAEYVRARCP